MRFISFPTALILSSFALNSPAQNCEADQAAFKQVSKQLADTRAGIKKNEDGLAYLGPVIDHAIEERNTVQSALQVMEKDSYKAKAANALINEYNRKIAEYRKNETRMKQELASQKKEEPLLLNSYHLIRDRLDANCGGVKKDPPKKVIPNVAGNYNSSYGTCVVTQPKGGTTVTCVVHYDTGGTSTLIGEFDGTRWAYTWRNSFNHHGTGAMNYTAGGAFTGWWIDKSLTPFTKGDWWMRPK